MYSLARVRSSGSFLGDVEFVGGSLLARCLGDEVVEEDRHAHLEEGPVDDDDVGADEAA